MMNGEEILEHFAARLCAVELALPNLLPLPRMPSPPVDLHPFTATYHGCPAVFPASWAPQLPSSLLALLGSIVDVEVFRLHYRFDAVHVPNGDSSALQQVLPPENSSQNAKIVSVSANPLPEAEKFPDDHCFTTPLNPIPLCTTEIISFEAFVSESSSLMKARKDQLLYLTWRSLPDRCTTTMPEEFCFFIDKLIHPLTTPDFIERDSIKQRNLWMGSLVTSRIHFDALDNVHLCLSGKKVFHLYSPSELPNLYPEPWREGAMNNFSSIGSVFFANQKEHSRYFHNAKCFRTEVNAGEAIFIPAGWWHEVFTLQETISVNVWFGPSSNASLRPTLLHLKSENYLQFMLGCTK